METDGVAIGTPNQVYRYFRWCIMKLSLKAMIIAGALFKAAAFLFISLMNLILRPYGGAYLAILSSLYPGYDPVNWPIAVIVGTLYSLLAGALAGLLFGWLYNFFAEQT
jgi:hypothetical protein